MDVSVPIAAVVPTLDAHVLTVLAGTTRPLTGQQVYRLANRGSPNGVRAVLGRLVHQGVVRADPAGRATLYMANRDHLAWDAVESLTTIRKTFISLVAQAILNWRVQPVSASLFGSAARGDGDADSDIDLLLISADDNADVDGWMVHVDDLRDDITRWTGNQCQIYDITEQEFRTHLAADEPIVDAWRNDAINLMGIPITQLISRSGTRR